MDREILSIQGDATRDSVLQQAGIERAKGLISVLSSDATGLGKHDVIWTGRDRAGREVPSGSYFARMYLDGKAVGPVAKMSLIR